MPVPTSAVKVNPVTGALIDPPVATFAAANGLLTSGTSDAKNSVRAATTTNGTLATAFENGDTIDGIVLATSDRILIKNQSAPAENGIYVVAASGAPTRATDFDAWTEIVGAFVSVESGTANAGTQWLCNVVAGGTLGTTAINFVVPQNYVNLTTNQTVAGNKHFATGSTIGGVEISKDTVNPAVNGSIQFLEDDSIFALSANAGSLWVHTTGDTDVTFPLSGTLLSTAAIGVSVQAYDADLTTWAGITPGANVGTFLATPSGANLASALTTALPETKGGTNQTTYTTGDLLYASASNTLSKLADVATGNALISGGVGVAPSWGKISLTTHVSGTLPEANGGTAFTSLVKFHAYKTADQTTTGGSYEQITFPSEEYDTGSNFASNAFTAPVAGKYIFGCSLYCGTAARIANIALYKNGSQIKRIAGNGGTRAGDIMSGSVTVSLAANDVMTIYSYTDGALAYTGAQTIAYFWGALLPGS